MVSQTQHKPSSRGCLCIFYVLFLFFSLHQWARRGNCRETEAAEDKPTIVRSVRNVKAPPVCSAAYNLNLITQRLLRNLFSCLSTTQERAKINFTSSQISLPIVHPLRFSGLQNCSLSSSSSFSGDAEGAMGGAKDTTDHFVLACMCAI